MQVTPDLLPSAVTGVVSPSRANAWLRVGGEAQAAGCQALADRATAPASA